MLYKDTALSVVPSITDALFNGSGLQSKQLRLKRTTKRHKITTMRHKTITVVILHPFRAGCVAPMSLSFCLCPGAHCHLVCPCP